MMGSAFAHLNFLVKSGDNYTYITAVQFFKKEERKMKIIRLYERSKRLV